MFDALDNGSSSADDDDEESLDPAGPEIPSLPRAAPLIAGSFPNGWDTPLPLPPAGPKELDASEQPASRLMPSWDSDFWNVYGNKLRVNGTVEGMCELVGR